MSGLHDGAPDPLAALRSSDRRPPSVIWKERMSQYGTETVARLAGRVGVAALVVALAVGIGWRLFVDSAPPVEASLPFATGALDEPAGLGEPVLDENPDPVAEVSSTVPTDSGLAEETEVVLHVAGAVAHPGLIRGNASWRIDDAIQAAGGLSPSADPDRVNLAAPVLDGQRIFVPYVDEPIPTVVQPEQPLASRSDPLVEGGPLVDLNTADSARLEDLPGIGPATATAIISHRQEFGRFASVDSLIAVSGIGPATVDSLRDHVTV